MHKISFKLKNLILILLSMIFMFLIGNKNVYAAEPLGGIEGQYFGWYDNTSIGMKVGKYYLTSNIASSDRIYLLGDTEIDLKGHTLSITKLGIDSSANVVIKDSVGGGKLILSGYQGSINGKPGVGLENNGTLIIDNVGIEISRQNDSLIQNNYQMILSNCSVTHTQTGNTGPTYMINNQNYVYAENTSFSKAGSATNNYLLAGNGSNGVLRVGSGVTTSNIKYTNIMVNTAKYNITYKYGNTNLTDIYPKWYPEGFYVKLRSPEVTGYNFGGWYTNSELTGNRVASISTTETGNKTFYAKLTGQTYSITYNLNGGIQNANNSSTYSGGVGATLYEPTKPGYEFGGWYTTSDFSGSAVTSIGGAETGNKTFYAKWTKGTYEIKYYYGVTELTGLEPNQYTYGETTTLPNFSLANYSFKGWYTNSSFSGNPVTRISATETGNKRYYAKMQGNSYTITYNLDGGNQNPENPESYTYGTEVELKDPIKVGYTFVGWYLSEDYAGNQIERITTTDVGNKTLYAKWEEGLYTVTFDNQGAYQAGTTTIQTKYGAILTNINIPAKKGYKFKGYYSEKNGSGTQYFDETGKGVQRWDIIGDTTLYASWEEVTYSIKYYYGNVNIAGLTPNSYKYGTAVTLPTYSVNNYTFQGWYTNKELTGSTVTSIANTDWGDKIFYAKLQKAFTPGLNNKGTQTYSKNCGYTGNIQSYTIPITGTYKLQTWGAQGGTSTSSLIGGYGGYSKGEVYLTKGTILYIGVGGQPTTSSGGYNGGGNAGGLYSSKGGGGATHIATTNNRGTLSGYNSYRGELLIVAGGGGGADAWATTNSGGHAGGYLGGNGNASSLGNGSHVAYGGSQSGGGAASYLSNGTEVNLYAGSAGAFGQGGSGLSGHRRRWRWRLLWRWFW